MYLHHNCDEYNNHYLPNNIIISVIVFAYCKMIIVIYMELTRRLLILNSVAK